MAVSQLDFGGKCTLTPAEHGGQHLAGGIAVIVNCLFAKHNQRWIFFRDHGLEQFGNRQRLNRRIGFDEDAAISAHGQGRADGFRRLCGPDGNNDDFFGFAGFFQPQGLFDGDFIKGVHRHFDIGEFDAGAVRFHANFYVVVNHPFHGNKNFHSAHLLSA